MDALRKAEQQKQQNATQDKPQGAFEPGNLELEPLSAQAGGNQLPELPQRLEDLDDQFFTIPSPKSGRAPAGTPPHEPGISTPSRKGADAASRATVRNVFEAKQAAAKEDNHSFAIVVGLSTLVAAAAIGGYLYWQMQPKGGLSAGPALAPATPALAPPPPAIMAQAPAAQPVQLPPPVAAPPLQPAATTASTASLVAAKPERPTGPAPRPDAQNLPIRVSSAVPKPDPALEKAHQAFNRGELELARTAWLGALQADPRNADALHGLAAIAQQGGQMQQAVDYYLRALEADPKDALALSGLASLGVAADTRQTENRLKSLLAELPDSPYLNFALGNLYAQDKRWAEAQQVYFKAHTTDPTNPDYLYNLAVSLDHLHQPRLAAQYYERALDATRQRVAGFDAARTATRLKTLQSGLPH